MINEPNTITAKQLEWVDASKKIKPTAIVLHWWQVPTWLGGIKVLYLGLKRRKLSVQFAILKNGDIYQLVKDPTTYCHHARCANKSSIGIELQGLNAKDLDKQPDQFQAVVNLVTYLCSKYKIPTSFEFKNGRFYGISSHKVVDEYCHSKRLRKKKDLHDEYLQRVIEAVSIQLKQTV
jgi:N-acetyl-anhydromuramyl-L-alanine amidase AmpD